MARWGEFAVERPDLAATGQALLYQHGVGLAFLSTVRADGGPRVHPMCPIFYADGLYAFIIPSPKQADLRRDGRYAMHSFPRPDDEDAFYCTGQATIVGDVSARAQVAQLFVAERAQFNVPTPADEDLLVEFHVDRCLLTTTAGHGDPTPAHTVWVAG
jgi:hypothetical protein